jgi:hypothetical protein
VVDDNTVLKIARSDNKTYGVDAETIRALPVTIVQPSTWQLLV